MSDDDYAAFVDARAVPRPPGSGRRLARAEPTARQRVVDRLTGAREIRIEADGHRPAPARRRPHLDQLRTAGATCRAARSSPARSRTRPTARSASTSPRARAGSTVEGVELTFERRRGRRRHRRARTGATSTPRSRPTPARASSASSGSARTPASTARPARPCSTRRWPERSTSRSAARIPRPAAERLGAALGPDLRPARRRPADRRRRAGRIDRRRSTREISGADGRHTLPTAVSYLQRDDAPHEDRRHDRARVAATPRRSRAWSRPGMDVARLNFSHGNREIHAENAERVARGRVERAGRQVAILQDLPGPKLRIGRAARTASPSSSRASSCVLLCGSDRASATSERMSVSWGGLAERGRPRRRDLPRRRRDPAAGHRRPRGRRRGRDGGRDRRLGRLAPGPQHPRLDARAAGGPRGGPRDAPLRRVDRRRPGRAVVRAHRRGRHQPCAGTRGCR